MKENIQVFDNVLQLIGKTPLIKLNSMTSGFNGEFYAKVEGFNPGHSSKDIWPASFTLLKKLNVKVF